MVLTKNERKRKNELEHGILLTLEQRYKANEKNNLHIMKVLVFLVYCPFDGELASSFCSCFSFSDFGKCLYEIVFLAKNYNFILKLSPSFWTYNEHFLRFFM